MTGVLINALLQRGSSSCFCLKVMKEKTKEGKDFSDLCFILERRDASRGSAIDAHCVCLGGRDMQTCSGCKNIAAAMYSLEELLNSRCEDSVTSGPCQWNKDGISFDSMINSNSEHATISMFSSIFSSIWSYVI